MGKAAPIINIKKASTQIDKSGISTSSNNTLENDRREEQQQSLTIDFPILPSTSTFSLSGKDDKSEKVKKKARNFLDERQKMKTRAQSLWNATNTLDQARFFQEHAEQVFQVVYDTCMHQIEKIKHKSERPQSWNSKELVNLQKSLLLLRKIFLFVPELMRNGWQRGNIAAILTHILDHRNHPRLRALGFHLLLLWLNDQVVEYPECMDLFANAITLDLFILDEIKPFSPTPSEDAEEKESVNNTNTATNYTTTHPHGNTHTNPAIKLQTGLHFVKKLRDNHNDRHANLTITRDGRIRAADLQLHQSLIYPDDFLPLYLNPVQPNYKDSIVLIHIFISNLVRLAYVAAGSPPPPDSYEYPPGDNGEPDDGIATGVGIDAATASAKFLFKIFRTYYLTKFVPDISKSLNIEGAYMNEAYGFPDCPPTILRSMLRFLIGYCIDNNHISNIHWPNLPNAPASSPATPILKSIVLSFHENREMLHEILRQSLTLPPTNSQYHDIIRGSIHILGVWILGSEDERPSFLRSNSVVTRSSSTTSDAISIHNEKLDSSRTLSSSPEESNLSSRVLFNQAIKECSEANVFLRRYISMIKLIFNIKEEDASALASLNSQVNDWEGLVLLYKDAINVYRAIAASRSGIEFEWQSWEELLLCLMDIQKCFMYQTDKINRIPNTSLAEDFADYIWETILHVFVRANTVRPELWKMLKSHINQSMHSLQPLNQWVKIMQKLTKLLSTRLYKVDYEYKPEKLRMEDAAPVLLGNRALLAGVTVEITGPTIMVNKSKARSRHLSMQEHKYSSMGDMLESTNPVPEGSVSTMLRNFSSASLSEIANTFKTERKSTNLTSVPDDDAEGIMEEEMSLNKNSKFGIKNIIPTTSYSSTPSYGSNHLSSSNSIGKRSINNTNTGNMNAAGGSGIGRRAISIQQLDSLWQDSGSKLINLVHHGSDNNPQSSSSKVLHSAKEEDEVSRKKMGDWDRRSGSNSIDRLDDSSSKSNRTSSSSLWPSTDSISITVNPNMVPEKLPTGLGSFRSSEFLVLSNLTYDGQHVLNIWKNMLLSIGNVNEIKDPQNYLTAIQCVVEIWDTLAFIRLNQPYRGVPIPAMYEILPWLFQSTQLNDSFNHGKAIALGGLCRLMSQKPEETITEGYIAAFYESILKGLSSDNNEIIQSIVLNSERLFSVPLPGIHILIPAFIDAIEKQLLDSKLPRDVSTIVRKSCITILGSFVSISNQLKGVSIEIDESDINYLNKFHGNEFTFEEVKGLLKNVLSRLVTVESTIPQTMEDIESHCMLLNTLCTLIIEELLVNKSLEKEFVLECLSCLVNHLYWCIVPIVNTASDCLNSLSYIYSEEYDPEQVYVVEIITGVIDALNVHLRLYDQESRNGRGFVIAKLFNCLLQWIMAVDPIVLTETPLCQMVFDVIEISFNLSSGTQSNQPRPHSTSKRDNSSFKFKLSNDKRPQRHQDYISNVSHYEILESDQGYVKESAEALLLHLLHHFNNFAPPYGPSIIHSTIVGPGVSQSDEEYNQYQYFSFNDTSIIAFLELPVTDTETPKTRIIVRDLTGRYVWDNELEPKLVHHEKEERTEIEDDESEVPFKLRSHMSITMAENTSDVMDGSNMNTEDPLSTLLKHIGESHPDCLLDPGLPLNAPTTSTTLQAEMLDRLGEHLDMFLSNEKENNEKLTPDVRLSQWKMNMLHQQEMRASKQEDNHTSHSANYNMMKDFFPAFPTDTEESHVPFQQSRLLLSHMGFIPYSHLKDGSFQMLNKSHTLYRDLRGLDRKPARENMKIALLYVGLGQEDEASILQNDRGSDRYNSFVNSLGWDINIASHHGYLGGLEKNLTNGTSAVYYCSSSLEMIFHDVTRMPTDSLDPKQIKKKRHIGNDHVHIVWNEHDKDYRIKTIGGDFGNAQIIITPLPDNLFFIQVHRDEKIPYFGPLLDRMIVSEGVLGPLVRSTAINAFRASIHKDLYSYYRCVYAQRSSDVKTIIQRHRIGNWSYEQFMEKIFMPDEQ
ncbi:hypothetical protein BDB01DRAFT_847455 [Pilobolus umbonatus]|nr:hypothetical protein BDB01DRAFT_847455 [Pilobolus umbonatus]